MAQRDRRAAVNQEKCPKRTTALAVDHAPTLKLVKPAYDRSTGHSHIGSNPGDRERLTSMSPIATHRAINKVSMRVPKGSLSGA
jgi:hypothetical protein